ncbi:phage antirepressor N-terminal domain-containing protein [Corynebacterium mastitidis]|uniref:Phage antirepressor n=1 Tax=Corynebacterium mastitidis TaxID=161890 RepID=A0A2N0X524_9CORY|nr:phage antirepressor N-terminal domain-containing protein [Corynebacterium mastitidis]MCH6197481.1 phage antirepressor N-terminal domain-containing protein [Corynebacterium mastitidis]PKF67791.1 phage antirepressor [Corynebacterium mastitidis]
MSTQLVSIPFHGSTVQAVDIDGKPHVVFRPIPESLGLDADSQMKRLRRRSWATTVKTAGVGADGKSREVVAVDLRTLTMWLATIDENRVSEEARPLVVAYQAEIADVIESYWTQGGAINPRATEHQMNALMFQCRSQMELCQAAKGLIHADHLEAKARVILARGMGEAPVLDPLTRPLYTQDFLRGKNLSRKQMSSKAGIFGKRVKRAYIEKYGREPEKYALDLSNGQTRQVNGYTEADRPLMEQVWDQYFAEIVKAA